MNEPLSERTLGLALSRFFNPWFVGYPFPRPSPKRRVLSCFLHIAQRGWAFWQISGRWQWSVSMWDYLRTQFANCYVHDYGTWKSVKAWGPR